VPGYLSLVAGGLSHGATARTRRKGGNRTKLPSDTGNLPYRLRWDARITETRRPNGFTIEATGDFVGRGVWTFEEHNSDLKILFELASAR
jgi:hypothetical protein